MDCAPQAPLACQSRVIIPLPGRTGSPGRERCGCSGGCRGPARSSIAGGCPGCGPARGCPFRRIPDALDDDFGGDHLVPIGDQDKQRAELELGEPLSLPVSYHHRAGRGIEHDLSQVEDGKSEGRDASAAAKQDLGIGRQDQGPGGCGQDEIGAGRQKIRRLAFRWGLGEPDDRRLGHTSQGRDSLLRPLCADAGYHDQVDWVLQPGLRHAAEIGSPLPVSTSACTLPKGSKRLRRAGVTGLALNRMDARPMRVKSCSSGSGNLDSRSCTLEP